MRGEKNTISLADQSSVPNKFTYNELLWKRLEVTWLSKLIPLLNYSSKKFFVTNIALINLLFTLKDSF